MYESRAVRNQPWILDHWAEEMRRAKGAPHSVLLPVRFRPRGSLDDNSLTGWTSPARKCFKASTQNARQLAVNYQDWFKRRMLSERDLAARPQPDSTSGYGMDDPAKKDVKESGWPDLSLEAFRECSTPSRTFRAPEEAKQYFPAEAQQQLTRLEQNTRNWRRRDPIFRRPWAFVKGKHRRFSDPYAGQPLDSRPNRPAGSFASLQEKHSRPFRKTKRPLTTGGVVDQARPPAHQPGHGQSDLA